MKYQEFLKTKKIKFNELGLKEDQIEIGDYLYDFQRDIVKWALKNGRAAIFAECGLGKTPMQLEWAKNVVNNTDDNVLILAPLAVSQQTIYEGEKFGIKVKYCRSQAEVEDGITITNYEMLKHFDTRLFSGVVLDESSILKSFDGKTKKLIIESFEKIPFRLACTATPAPNDILEIANHAEFLGIMNQKEMIALYFIQDGSSKDFKLKNHAVGKFWEWMASWSVALRNPQDLGYDGKKFELPKLNVNKYFVNDEIQLEDYLFTVNLGLNDAKKIRKQTIESRAQQVKKLIEDNPGTWLIWCDLNDESDELKRIIPGSVEVRGSDSIEDKEKRLIGFSRKEHEILITKPSIAGFGLNWQHCHNVAFCGLSFSYEQFYQAIRRCWRFGQEKDVNVNIVIHEHEKPVLNRILKKEEKVENMMSEITNRFKFYFRSGKKEKKMNNRIEKSDNWKMILGDCIEKIDEIEDNSLGFSIFSPPFPAMYAYTDMEEDIGNVRNITELVNHFGYLIEKLHKKLMPGRNVAVHLTQMPAFKRDYDYVGLKDFRGEVIRTFEKFGWIYYSEVTINKCPQVKAIRTKDSTLTFKGLCSDSSKSRPAMADYLLIFRKKGENPIKIPSGNTIRYNNPNGWISDKDWIKWAAPVWTDIKETEVLNYRDGKAEDDEKHLCPLQLEVIRRSVLLWTNPDEIVFSPFAGIGSEGYVSLENGRRFIGIELKESYFEQAIKNLKNIEYNAKSDQLALFS